MRALDMAEQKSVAEGIARPGQRHLRVTAHVKAPDLLRRVARRHKAQQERVAARLSGKRQLQRILKGVAPHASTLHSRFRISCLLAL